MNPVFKPYKDRVIDVYVAGASDAAVEVAGRHADIFDLWGETYEQVRDLTGRVRAAAAKHGRRPEFSLSFRPILADTEEAAWAKADAYLERAKALLDRTGYRRGTRSRPMKAPAGCWPLPRKGHGPTSACGPKWRS